MRQAPLYRDIFQRALYGQSRDQLSILCEDDVAEGVIRGVLDVLNVELRLLHGDVVIDRNTGRDEFPGHVRTLAKFNKLSSFIFVLDGDSRALKDRLEAIAENARVVFLPGDDPPEHWLWKTLHKRPDQYASPLGVTEANLKKLMQDIDRQTEGGVQQRDAAKVTMAALAHELQRRIPEIARIVGHGEAQRKAIPELLTEFRALIERWRRL